MKPFLLCAFLFGIIAGLCAQQLHFVYLQTDSRRPFYISLNNKNFSSSAIGYVILPKLQNGNYPVRIGFPKSEEPEKEFLLQVKDNDQGFLIKDFGDKGWGLFNLQSLNVQYAGAAAQQAKELTQQKTAEQKRLQQEAAAETNRRNDSLQAIATQRQQQAETLRQHYTDSVLAVEAAIRQHRYEDSIQKAISSTATEKQVNEQAAMAAREQHLTDSLNNAQATVLENERLEKIADSTARIQAAGIEKGMGKKGVAEKPTMPTLPADSVLPYVAEQNQPATNSPILLQRTFTDTGWHYAYAITNGGHRETIDVFIPSRQPQAPMMVAAASIKENPVASAPDSNQVIQPEATTETGTKPEKQKKEDETKSLNTELGEKKDNTPALSNDTTPIAIQVLHNSNCRAMANEKDFLNARKKIVSAEGTDNMIAVARKFMKEKCFTTEQVRNLSFLFLTDADRYQFLDAAYPFALDSYRFHTLQDLLKDDYYVQRFKAMIR